MDKLRIQQALSIPDLSDPVNGTHAINLALIKIEDYLGGLAGWPKPIIVRKNPVSTVADNFDRLYFPLDNLSRSPVYTRYIDEKTVLRVHTSAMIPDLLIEMREKGVEDFLLMCPGLCYRRDVVDRTHIGELHQMDIWRVKRGGPRLVRKDLIELIEMVLASVIPSAKYRANEVNHPYTINGLEVEIRVGETDWLELLECGEAHPQVLADAGLDPSEYSGLAMGLGLDRLVMLAKDIDDIRILRAEDPRIKAQMLDLSKYRSVSKYPPIRQDISISIDQTVTEEDICEMIRDAMGSDIDVLEEVKIVSETAYDCLPPQAIERLGIKNGQKNILIRMIFRSHKRSLVHDEANIIRNRVYMIINQGDKGYIT